MSDRCICYDWVEVFALERDDLPARTPAYYVQEFGGRNVEVREYGTPMYNEMFSISHHGRKLIEIRRDPKSKMSEGGIFPDNCCHIRLTNRVCYYPDPIGYLIAFMQKHHLTYSSTKRIDIALDFNRFDTGDDPAAFLRRYYANKYAKMYQREYNNHGEDGWQTKLHNSVKWGSPSSDITTKLYNKTMELNRPGHDKPYIRERWQQCGLNTSKDVWRVEFSLGSSMKNLVRESDGSLMPLDLMAFRTYDDILNIFMTLADRYFDFRYVETLPNGKLQRKDRCKRKQLFDITHDERAYKPISLPTEQKEYDRSLFQVVRRMAGLALNDTDNLRDVDAVRRTCELIINQYAVDEFHRVWLNKVMASDFLPSLFRDDD